LETILITSAIGTYEGRAVAVAVAVVDVPGSFISANMDEEVIMAIQGWLAELIKNTPHIYWKYITLHSKKFPVLYDLPQKALYGCLRSALLFYEKIIGDLE
jgi:hypothetical protein